MPAIPRLHVVTDDRVLATDAFPAAARRVLEVGGSRLALHVRGPRSSGRLLFDRASALRDAAGSSGALLLVNDRVDVALAARADGVHLGARSLSVGVARTLLPPSALVGASVRDATALARAAADGANHAFVGTVHPTDSHPGRSGIGPEGLADIVGRARGIPVLGIGGIGVGQVDAILCAGAHGVAVLSGIWSAPDPADAVLDYLAALEDAKDGAPAGGTTRRPTAEERT